MHDALVTYFQGEKHAGLFLAVAALLGLVAAALFWQPRFSLRPLALTLAVFALIELAIGVGLYLKSGPQVDGLVVQLGKDAAGFFAAEGARMARVQRNFVAIEYIEVALIAITALVALTQKGRFGLAAVALGVLLNASLLLAFDLVAERRGAIYLEELRAGAPARP